MSFESWEFFREQQRENFKRRLQGMEASHERQIAEAKTPEERESLSNAYRKSLNTALEKQLNFSRWAPAYGALGSAIIGIGIWIIAKLPIAWDQLPNFLTHPLPRLIVAGSVAGLGWIFFLLRKSSRGIYATLELTIACATAYKSAYELGRSERPDRWAYVLALIGSVYIAVRAFDNFDKHWNPEKEALKKLVAEALSATMTKSKEGEHSNSS